MQDTKGIIYLLTADNVRLSCSRFLDDMAIEKLIAEEGASHTREEWARVVRVQLGSWVNQPRRA